MPFDPTIPQPGTLIDADQIRSQLNALNDAIQCIITYGAITGVQVESVTTEPPGNPASAGVSMDSSGLLRFTLGIPQGVPGEVTQAQLSNDLANHANYCIQQSLNQSSNYSNAVTTLDTPMAGTDADLLRLKLNELILALRR